VHHPTHPLSLRVKHTHTRHNEEKKDDDHHHHQNPTKKTDGHQKRVGCEDLILSPQEVKRIEKKTHPPPTGKSLGGLSPVGE
jgi:hypothetical protein